MICYVCPDPSCDWRNSGYYLLWPEGDPIVSCPGCHGALVVGEPTPVIYDMRSPESLDAEITRKLKEKNARFRAMRDLTREEP